MKRVTTIILLLLSVVAILGACGGNSGGSGGGSHGKAGKRLNDAIESFVNSEKNPLRTSYTSYDYEEISSSSTDDVDRAVVLLTEESKTAHVELSVEVMWYKEGKETQVAFRSSVEDAYPLTGPSDRVYTQFEDKLRVDNPGSDISVGEGEWEPTSSICSCPVTISDTYSCYIETSYRNYTLSWDLYDEDWSITSKYKEDAVSYDFSPMNGTWRGLLHHNSTLLSKEDIEYTFTFSNAGTMEYKDGGYSVTYINVDHTIDDIFPKYITDMWTEDKLPSHERGKMEIRKNSGGGFIITFRETNLSYMFSDGTCEIKIGTNDPIYSDPLSKECYLRKQY